MGWWIGGLVVWWFGGLVVWRFGGLEVWRFGGGAKGLEWTMSSVGLGFRVAPCCGVVVQEGCSDHPLTPQANPNHTSHRVLM